MSNIEFDTSTSKNSNQEIRLPNDFHRWYFSLFQPCTTSLSYPLQIQANDTRTFQTQLGPSLRLHGSLPRSETYERIIIIWWLCAVENAAQLKYVAIQSTISWGTHSTRLNGITRSWRPRARANGVEVCIRSCEWNEDSQNSWSDSVRVIS